MTNSYSTEGILILIVLIICTCSYFRRITRIKKLMEENKKGFFGVFYKASVLGIKLHWLTSIACLALSFYVLLIK
eukprot:gene10970-gene3674